jgi:phosphohistidine phosphatase
MFIYLLRHGDAAQDASLHDSERPLTAIGVQQAETVARFFFRSRVAIHTIFCSPLKRAQQTADPMRRLFPDAKFLLTEYLVPGNDLRQVFDAVNENISDSILLVGHEPSLSELTASLISASSDAKLEFKKSCLACLEATPPLRKGHAVLKWLLPIDVLQLLNEQMQA